jgi:hypothetical protein
MLVFAQDDTAVTAAKSLLARIEDAILFPIMSLLLAGAFLFFLYGAFQFVYGAADGEVRQEGKKHMMWGIIGLFIMVSALGLLRIAANTFGVDVPDV